MVLSEQLPRRAVHRIFLIDDHPVMRAGLAKLIDGESDLELCGEIEGGRGAVGIVERACPDVILLDLSLGDRSGLELIKDLRAAGIPAGILVVSMHDEVLYAERVLRAGANGYLMKVEAPGRVIEGIRTVARGGIFLSDKMSRSMLHSMVGGSLSNGEKHLLSVLTDREFEVLRLIGKGHPPRVIADSLGISPKTIDTHRAHIKEKLGFANGAELLRFAVLWAETGEVEVEKTA